MDAAIKCYETDKSIAGLERLVDEYLPAASNEMNKLDERRGKGGKHVSSEIQQFAKTFADFLGCYSQIVDIVKEADTQFGGVAIQTLSLLLVVGFRALPFQPSPE